MTKKLAVARSRLARPMSLREVAIELGYGDNEVARRKLSRFILAREKEVGRPIMIRLAGADRPKYRVTIPTLERHCSELFNQRHVLGHELGQQFNESVDALTEDISALRRLIDQLTTRVFSAEGAIIRLERQALFAPRPTAVAATRTTPAQRMRDAQRRIAPDDDDTD